MEHQVRIARIAAGRLEAFIAEWTANEARLRRRFGFTIEGAWTVEATGEFICVLGYDGDDGFAAAEERYLGSEEYASIESESAAWVEDSRIHPVRKVV